MRRFRDHAPLTNQLAPEPRPTSTTSLTEDSYKQKTTSTKNGRNKIDFAKWREMTERTLKNNEADILQRPHHSRASQSKINRGGAKSQRFVGKLRDILQRRNPAIHKNMIENNHKGPQKTSGDHAIRSSNSKHHQQTLHSTAQHDSGGVHGRAKSTNMDTEVNDDIEDLYNDDADADDSKILQVHLVSWMSS